MARPRKAMPTYRPHISGQAVVTLDGRDFYLGPHDSPESHAKYLELLQVYQKNGLKMPADVAAHQGPAPITIRCLTAEFRNHILVRYANQRQEKARFEGLCALLEEEYANLPVDEFGPRKLEQIRDLFVKSGNSRKYANRQTNNIIRIFKYGVSRELLHNERVFALQCLEPLRFGQTTARETEPVRPAKLDDVKATAKHLSPTLKAMVRVQVGTGMRPSEVCNMRPCDTERRADGAWIYRPEKHKTQSRGKTKAVPLGKEAQQTLLPFLDRNPESYCFSPRESSQWYREQRTANRKTAKSCGNKVGTNRKANPKRQPGEKFDSGSYRQSLQRAAKKAKVDHWFPYQLRHLAGTVIRDALGVEAAQAVLGHSRAAMTEHYAKLSLEKAIEAAKVAPSIGD